MKNWQRAHRRAQLYEQLCVLTDSLLDLTITWWNADPDLHDLPVPSSAQLELPLAEHASPSGSLQPPACSPAQLTATPPELD